MRTFLDTNLLLDIIEQRVPFVTASQQVAEVAPLGDAEAHAALGYGIADYEDALHAAAAAACAADQLIARMQSISRDLRFRSYRPRNSCNDFRRRITLRKAQISDAGLQAFLKISTDSNTSHQFPYSISLLSTTNLECSVA